MPDFYADHPFTEVVLKIPDAAKLFAIGDCVAGMKSGTGRVEKLVEDGIVVHPIDAGTFEPGDLLASPNSTAAIAAVEPC